MDNARLKIMAKESKATGGFPFYVYKKSKGRPNSTTLKTFSFPIFFSIFNLQDAYSWLYNLEYNDPVLTKSFFSSFNEQWALVTNHKQ